MERSSTPQQPLEALQQQTKTLCDTAYFHDVVVRHCPALSLPVQVDQQTNAPELVIEIHPADQMLNHSLFHHRDANAAFSQYYNVGLQQFSAAQQVLELLFPQQREHLQLLDFACGYGRLLRFMSQYMPRSNLFASEIQTDALAYVKDTFKVQTIASHSDPDNFHPDTQFDVIWVASLFSHLPQQLFSAWLKRLTECLKPDGVLCFSVHDACLVPEGHEFPTEEGYLFWPQSENADLDTRLYGTTYVNERFVKGIIADVCGPEQRYYRLPRALAHEQDIYLVTGSAGRELGALAQFRRGPWGWVDERSLSAEGLLYLRGWAASIDDGALKHIHITVNGTQVLCPTGKIREDVARVFADPRLSTSGWELSYQLPNQCDIARIEVTASTERGEYALLYTGDLQQPRRTPQASKANSWLTDLWRRLSARLNR